MKKPQTIKEMETYLEHLLLCVPGYDSYAEFGSCERGDGKVLYGPHVNVYFRTTRVGREQADEVLVLFQRWFSATCRRKCARPACLHGNDDIKSELVLLF